jgi:hypothetical protein
MGPSKTTRLGEKSTNILSRVQHGGTVKSSAPSNGKEFSGLSHMNINGLLNDTALSRADEACTNQAFNSDAGEEGSS